MTTNNTTSPGTLYNIAPEGKAQLYTAAEIRAPAPPRSSPPDPERTTPKKPKPAPPGRNQNRPSGASFMPV